MAFPAWPRAAGAPQLRASGGSRCGSGAGHCPLRPHLAQARNHHWLCSYSLPPPLPGLPAAADAPPLAINSAVSCRRALGEQLGRLRALRWNVNVADTSSEPEELPLPPRLEHLWVDNSEGWAPPKTHPALAGLQTFVATYVWARAQLLALLGELRGLTELHLVECGNAALLPNPLVCTGLRRLVIACCNYLGGTPEGVAWLGEALQRLPHLEDLQLPHCNLASLLTLTSCNLPQLQQLDIAGNECTTQNAGWLASLEDLGCSWWQVGAVLLRCLLLARTRENLLLVGDPPRIVLRKTSRHGPHVLKTWPDGCCPLSTCACRCLARSCVEAHGT